MTTAVFEPALLPEEIKREMCEELLREFNVPVVRTHSRKGELWMCCPLPWHDDRNPSASLNYKKLAFNCFSCGSSGGLLWFIAECRGVSAKQARDWVATKSGLSQGSEFSLDALLHVIDAIFNHQVEGPQVIPSYSPAVLKPWQYIHPYLTDTRRIPEQTIVEMKCGWNPDEDRIVIPHFWRGKLVGWQSRRLRKDGTPKYLSTAEFPRESTLFNAQNGDHKLAIVAEAPMSCLRHLHHMPEFKATMGDEVTDRQVKLLAHYDRVIWFPDPDPGGWNAVSGVYEMRYGKRIELVRSAVEKLSAYTDVRVVQNPWAADPADMDDQTVESLVREAVPFPVWVRPKRSELKKWRPRTMSMEKYGTGKVLPADEPEKNEDDSAKTEDNERDDDR